MCFVDEVGHRNDLVRHKGQGLIKTMQQQLHADHVGRAVLGQRGRGEALVLRIYIEA